ncbi:MAG: hypothetical protein ACOWYE_06825 [Desulfatiglandales bacterium]
MHTAEHILNQTMVRMFQCGRAFSAHIEKKKSKCDYHFDRSLTEQEISQIQDRVNEVIHADMPIGETFVNREEAQGRFDLGRLPEGADDTIRIVTIGDYDACPCIGAHVESSGQIGSFRITTTNYEKGVLRIRFKLSDQKSD